MHTSSTFDIKEHEPLYRYTSWRIGGPARYYTEVLSVVGLRDAIAWARQHTLPILLLGGGTNLLIRDSGFAGLVVRYRSQGWHVEEREHDEGRLHIQAGTPVAGTARRVARQGWQGLEWAEGLPGTIGGAIYGNAGCYGGDIATTLERVHLLMHGTTEEVWSVERLQYGYRHSILKEMAASSQQQDAESIHHEHIYPRPETVLPPVILAAEFRIRRGDTQELIATMDHIAAQRKAKTPWGHTCGSIFKNPRYSAEQPGTAQHAMLLTAGQLIDQAGLKGKRIGGAMISERHANYIVNLGGASSDDVLNLIDLARTTVLQQYGIELALEVQIV